MKTLAFDKAKISRVYSFYKTCKATMPL